MPNEYRVLNVLGPYREPREPAFSFDYSVLRPDWPTPQGIRVKVSIEHELEYCKRKVLQISGGTPGQQLRINQLLSRSIADKKLEIGNQEGMFSERRDVMIDPFVDMLSPLFGPLSAWMEEERGRLRQEITEKVGI